MLQWIRKKRSDTATVVFAASPGAELIDFLLTQLPQLDGAEPVLQKVEAFRRLPLEEQELQLPATYLFIERSLLDAKDSPLEQAELRALVAKSHAAPLEQPGFGLIFEPAETQRVLLCRELLATLLDRAFEVLGATGDNLLHNVRQWLEAVPQRMPQPIPFGVEAAAPRSTEEWVRLLGRLTRALYRHVEGILGPGSARRLFELGYDRFAQRYLELSTFSVVVELLPDDLLDEHKLRELDRGQMRQVVLDKVERLRQANEELSQKNRQLEEARLALQQVNEELEDRVRDRTEALRVVNDELRESEERLRRITSAANDAIVMWDQNGRVSFWNSAAERIFGYSQAEILDQDVCKALIPWRFHSMFRRGLHSFGETGGFATGETVEWMTVGRDRDEFPIELSLSMVKIQDRRHALAVIRDISERKQAEEERLQLEERMQQNQRLESLGLLAGGLAHDFNNLLSTITGNAGLALRRGSADDGWRGNLHHIETAAARAADLTRQMLAYSGRGQFIVAPIDLSEVVEEMTQLLRVSISTQGEMDSDLAADLPAIEADRSQIQQVVMNLITNASEALGQSGGSITVRTGLCDVNRADLTDYDLGSDVAPGRFVCLEVADTGDGMDSETRGKIFEPFFSTKFVGRGLGLAAVSGIVRGHGGAIRVQSQPGGGTTFQVLLPASAKPVERVAKLLREEVDRSVEMHRDGTILVVDDETDVREMVQFALQDLGFRVLSAADGQQAVEVFRGHSEEIDLVLMDMTMPRMNGRQALREIRQLQADARVILSSGYSRKDVLRDLDGDEPNGFLRKPYTLPMLTAELTSALDRAEAAEPV
ncbi:MAG: PAS domain S-box protein [Acidobacteriota bacterium]